MISNSYFCLFANLDWPYNSSFSLNRTSPWFHLSGRLTLGCRTALSRGLCNPGALQCGNTPVWFPVLFMTASRLRFWHLQDLPYGVCDNKFQLGFGIHEDFLLGVCDKFAVTWIVRKKDYLLITHTQKIGRQKAGTGKGQRTQLSLLSVVKRSRWLLLHFLPFSLYKPLPKCQLSTDTLGSHWRCSLSPLPLPWTRDLWGQTLTLQRRIHSSQREDKERTCLNQGGQILFFLFPTTFLKDFSLGNSIVGRPE